MQNEAWLENRAGDRTLLQGSCVLGRASDAAVVINDPKVSRRHAMIHEQAEGEFCLIDLGSANGTRLNKRRIGQPTRLADGDVIEVAQYTFTFHQPTNRPHSPFPRETTVEATVHEIRRLECWLLVGDIVNSTQVVSRLSDEQAATLTGRWLDRCRKVVHDCSGAINKYLGDGFLAYWPDGPGVEGRVADALRQLEASQDPSRLAFRLVLHHGVATSGGAPTMGEENLAGGDVIYVFRMEELAGQLSLGFLASEAAARRLAGRIELMPVPGKHRLQGYDGEFIFYERAVSGLGS